VSRRHTPKSIISATLASLLKTLIGSCILCEKSRGDPFILPEFYIQSITHFPHHSLFNERFSLSNAPPGIRRSFT
jgi:hypothetical protein